MSVKPNPSGGALRDHGWLAQDHLIATIPGQAGQDKRNHQPSWFHFALPGVKGRTLTVDLAGFEGEYIPPYTLRHVNQLLDSIRRNPAVRIERVGRSVQGSPLHVVTIADRRTPDAAKKRVWLVCRQHAWEAGVSWALEGIIRGLLAGTDESRSMLARNAFHIVRTMDPDGLALGGVRFNRNGYDLNRNWDVEDPSKMPEIAAVKRWMLAQRAKPDVFVTMHNTEPADFPQGPLAEVRELGGRLNKLLMETSHSHAPNGVRGYPAEAPAPGRYTVDQWVFKQFRAPAFLLELMVDTNPKLGRPPHTAGRQAFGAAMARAIAAAL